MIKIGVIGAGGNTISAHLPKLIDQKDVEVIAPKEIFLKHDAPIDFWNKNVFKFGGQMLAKPYEDIL